MHEPFNSRMKEQLHRWCHAHNAAVWCTPVTLRHSRAHGAYAYHELMRRWEEINYRTVHALTRLWTLLLWINRVGCWYKDNIVIVTYIQSEKICSSVSYCIALRPCACDSQRLWDDWAFCSVTSVYLTSQGICRYRNTKYHITDYLKSPCWCFAVCEHPKVVDVTLRLQADGHLYLYLYLPILLWLQILCASYFIFWAEQLSSNCYFVITSAGESSIFLSG